MFKLHITSQFKRKHKKLTNKNPRLKKEILRILEKMIVNPLNPSLRPHKVKHKSFGRVWSIRVTGDIRIMWDFQKGKEIITFTIGRHSGKDKVYR